MSNEFSTITFIKNIDKMYTDVDLYIVKDPLITLSRADSLYDEIWNIEQASIPMSTKEMLERG